jgi:hypothetical protein
VTPAAGDPPPRAIRGALVAGLVPGQLLGWSWPDRLRHALALAAGGLGETRERSAADPATSTAAAPATSTAAAPATSTAAAPTISTSAERDHVDLAAYERLLDAVTVERSS